MARRRKGATQDFWEQAASATTQAGQEAGARGRRVRRMRRFVTFTVLTWPLLVLVLVALASSSLSPATTDGGGGEPAVPAPVRAAALEEVSTWLDEPSQPLPGGQVLGWDRADLVPWPDVETKDRSERYDTYVAHVLAATERLSYDVAVHVAWSPTRGASVVGSPSLSVVGSHGPGGGWDPGTWPLAQSAPLTEQVSRAVSAWGAAYAGGSADTLASVVADPDPSHSYQPLSGLKDVDVRPAVAATRAVDAGADPDPSTVMVQVQVTASREGARGSFTMSFDVLVADATSGSAHVVAWGPSGSGPTLVAYGNAASVVPGQPEATVSPTPTSTATPTKEGDRG